MVRYDSTADTNLGAGFDLSDEVVRTDIGDALQQGLRLFGVLEQPSLGLL